MIPSTWTRRLPVLTAVPITMRGSRNVLNEMNRMKIVDEKEDYIRAEAR